MNNNDKIKLNNNLLLIVQTIAVKLIYVYVIFYEELILK